jgi:hypothetical protein
MARAPRVAEFFAGIGLVRKALESEGFRIEDVSENAAIFGFGDAVCVPAVAWVARTYLLPLLKEKFPPKRRRVTTKTCPAGMSLTT